MKREENNQDPQPDFLPKGRSSGGYKVPQNYFSMMQRSVMDKLHKQNAFDESNKSPAAWRIWNVILAKLSPKPVLAMATMAIAVLATWFVFRNPTTQAADLVLSDTEIESYILSHADEFDDEMVFRIGNKLRVNVSQDADWLQTQSLDDSYLLDQIEDLDEQSLNELIL
ncbi:MAG: hypothetical protein ABIV51_07405 [Saprospiraceae bacterium]